MDLSLRPERINSIILINDLEDFSVLFNPLTAETMGLNSTGVLIWGKIDGERTIADIVKILSYEFSVEFERALVDVSVLFEKMHRRMFVKFKERNHFEPGDMESE